MIADAIPYELHLTLRGLEQGEEQAFLDFCARNAAKPLLIELARGQTSSQPMFSKVVSCLSIQEALRQMRANAALLEVAGYSVCRLKMEVPAACACRATLPETADFQPYYEWHGRIAYREVAALHLLCARFAVHLSRNALRQEAETRFITLREYGDEQHFSTRLDVLKSELEAGAWTLFKEQSEYCVYDDNLALDKGWLSL
ncbi:hypothetical protein [Taibaiella koreensis]|uniref:hypothetical protein n=1 Tax=Taibaiella koreensis TaxID=1268548 RepID=UPI000E59D292|nr:hypothetical protein [Taibaiella koreensis]